MWPIAALNIDFMLKNASTLGIDLSSFDGRIIDQKKSMFGRIMTGQYSDIGNSPTTLDLMKDQDLGWLADLNHALRYLGGKASVKHNIGSILRGAGSLKNKFTE